MFDDQKLFQKLAPRLQRVLVVDPNTASVKLLQEVMDERMFPLTLDGLDRAMRALTR